MRLRVNGQDHDVTAPDEMPLLWVLRDIVGLTGTKFGCGMAQCGACTVHLDGQAVRSCVLPVSGVQGRAVKTIEGLAPPGGSLHPLQQAFIENHGLQCGFCTPGFLMLATGVLEREPNISDEDLIDVLSSNLCRCTGYENIVKAVRAAAAQMGGGR